VPSGNEKPLACHALLGKPVFQYAKEALEAVAGPCITLIEDGVQGDASATYPVEREFAASFLKAVSSFDAEKGKVLAIYGDMPCLVPETLRFLLEAVEDGCRASFLQWQGEDVEQEPGLRLGGTAYCFEVDALKKTLHDLESAKEECTPLDALAAMMEEGVRITPVAADGEELISVKTRLDLANAFACLQEQINLSHMENGVTILAPDQTYIEADVVIGPDTVIYPGCFLQCGTKIGARCTLLPNSRLKGAVLHDEVTVESSVLLDCEVGSGTTVGPFAYLRPDTHIGKKCRIGDFVEVKNSVIGDGTKVSHLTYVGDGDLGKNINLGCGVVFSNYDGKKKHRSTVEDNAFIGGNVNLISPVHVGREAYVAAGSTVTSDVPEGSLYVARAQGVVKEGWVQKRKESGKL
jgi:bifunctional UDP-N-acetylglucosamine pyrophosphorylase/glucosamine-1-phosphate N-acetyltransferase